MSDKFEELRRTTDNLVDDIDQQALKNFEMNLQLNNYKSELRHALKRVEDDLYVCTCQYVQYFYGYNADGMLLYGDKTTKRIKCYVKVEQVEDGIEYMIMLGDVKAMSTERL